MKAQKNNTDIKCLAFYLPQYHPIPENDAWWGKGFTEWTNVTKAVPLFKGHRQPVFPADLGYYDLRVPEIRAAQAKMARDHGVYGFIYYHYWFGNGRHLLDQPLKAVLASKTPDFPFCICWANETWSGIWHGSPDKVLIRQEYPGDNDIALHFDYLEALFNDPRYIRVNDCPLIIIYDGLDLPNPKEYTDKLRAEVIRRGFNGLYIMASNKNPDSWDFSADGFDGKITFAYNKLMQKFISASKQEQQKKQQHFLYKRIGANGRKKPICLDQQVMVEEMTFEEHQADVYPMVLPNWDNTPRSGKNGVVIQNTTPELFDVQVQKSIDYINRKGLCERFMILKSWNEWAEGNYVEPDTRYGYAYLEVLKKRLM
ncbi:glycoside hydrolase family 99-like domain-containing protein [Niabella sp.]|uniref:glycosyltransferase WbsX family protein n=1 Tax=Niabella sp. TaxID=1962976 RepID=UPI00260B6ADF|nr:glycoside hydrolase family 99-like domain-containing protein [Niabella sp.]